MIDLSLSRLPASRADLMAALRAIAGLRLSEGRSLPSAIYGNPEVAELERTAIFQKGWICIGRADQLPNAGDFLTDTVDGQAVVAIRQKDGSIKVFANSCLHRLTAMLEGEGHLSGPLVCPYHAWSYTMDGRLIATPYANVQNRPECKAGNIRLKEFAAETWGGFLFVSLDEKPEPLAPQLAGLEAQLPGVNMDRYRETRMHDEVWDCDWKMLTDNFIEGYHIFIVHRTTLEPLTPTRNGIMKTGDDAYSIQYYPLVKEAVAELAHPDKSGVPDDGRNLVFTFHVFPCFVVSGSHNWLWWMSIQPQGINRAKLRWGICLTPEVIADPSRTGYADELDAFIAKANEEDLMAVTRARRGTGGPLPLAGHLAPLDQPLWEFIRYLDRALNGTAAGQQGRPAASACREE